MAWENYGVRLRDRSAGRLRRRRHASSRGTTKRWSPSLGGRPGYDTPGNVDHRQLAGFEPAPFTPRTPAPEPPASSATTATRRRRTSPAASRAPLRRRRHDRERARAVAHGAVAVLHRAAAFAVAPAEHVRARVVHRRDRGARQGRSGRVSPAPPERPAAQGRGARQRRRPRTGRRVRRRGPAGARTGVASGRGIACVAYEGDNGYVAMVAEVEVNQATGSVTVKRFVVAQDCGPISNPDGMRNQIEGGALQGLSRALGEEVTWDDRRSDVDRLAHLSQPAARLRRAGHRERADQPDGRRGEPAPAKRRSPSSPPRSATRSSTRPVRASARCRSRRSASRPPSRRVPGKA